MVVGYEDSGTLLNIINIGLLAYCAPLEHVGDFELVFLLTCRSSGARTYFTFRYLLRLTILTG